LLKLDAGVGAAVRHLSVAGEKMPMAAD